MHQQEPQVNKKDLNKQEKCPKKSIIRYENEQKTSKNRRFYE
jgi:hypothetical protein